MCITKSIIFDICTKSLLFVDIDDIDIILKYLNNNIFLAFMLFSIANIDDIVPILIPIFSYRKLSVFNVDIVDIDNIIPFIRYHCYCILFRRYRQQSWSFTVHSTTKARYCNLSSYTWAFSSIDDFCTLLTFIKITF